MLFTFARSLAFECCNIALVITMLRHWEFAFTELDDWQDKTLAYYYMLHRVSFRRGRGGAFAPLLSEMYGINKRT